jgi:TPP-dependent pyruvate/acetoin dehydrogenase alpha subunit
MPMPREQMLPQLETMLLMRRTEEAICEMQEEFPGNFHVYIGQEATGASVISQLTPEDHIFTTHRNHAHNVARGVPPEQVLAEILGRTTGPSGGKGGTFHVMSAAHHTVATAIVGGSTILAGGAGLAAQVLGEDKIGVAFLGDRTLNEGAVYEAFNLAALWQLPVLYVCENNVGEPFEPRSSNMSASQLLDVVRAFQIDTEVAEAFDPVAFHDVAERAVHHVRSKRRPMFLEARTNRWPGNMLAGDPSLSATGPTDISMAWSPPANDQYEAWYRSDPVLRLTRAVIEEEIADQAALLKLDAQVKRQIDRALAAARAAPEPTGESAFEHALAGGDLWPR